MMLLSPNSENVFPKEKKNASKKRSKKSTKKNQYQLFTQDAIIELYRKREKEKAQQEQQKAENLSNNDENSENSHSEQEEKKKKKTVKEIIRNLKSFVFDILYYEKNTIEDFGRTINTIHSKLFGKKEGKEDGDLSIDSSSTESLDFDEKNDENSQEEMKKLYLSVLASSIVMTPEQIDQKYKNFVNYVNALSTLPNSTDANEHSNDNGSDTDRDNHQLPSPSPTLNKNDFFEEGIISEEEEHQIRIWKLQNEKEMDKIEEKLTPRKKRNRNDLLKNITKSPYKLSNWITNDGLLPQPRKPNSSSEFIVFAPKTPSKKNKKSRNNVYFVGNENGKPLETSDKNTRDNMEFKVCQTPLVPKRSKSMIEDRRKMPLVRSQSLLDELNSIAAADDKENANINANRKDSSGNQNTSDGDHHEDTGIDSAKLEIKNLFEASFSKGNLLSRSRSFNEDIHSREEVKKKDNDFSFSIKSLYDSYLNTNGSQSSSGSQDGDRFNIFSRSSIHLNGSDGDSPQSNDSITFHKWLPKDINNPSDGSNNEKTPSISDHGNHDNDNDNDNEKDQGHNYNHNDSPAQAKDLDDLEQLKHQYAQHSASENRRLSYSPSPSPTPMSYSREISLSPTFNKINRTNSYTLGLDTHPSFLDFTNTMDQEKDSIFPPTKNSITTTPKVDRRSSFINFNPRSFDLSSDSGGSGSGGKGGGGGGGEEDHSPTPASTTDKVIFQKPWSRRQALTESPTRITEKEEEEEEEIMRTPSKRKLKQSHFMFTTFTSPNVKRKNRPFDDNDFPQTKNISPSSSTSSASTSLVNPSLSKRGGKEEPSQYLK
ncbi:hypothetical protein PIROE2DRAFT_63963, partial [Piromyces sp. E2]